jgi:hypothetical protein
MKRLFVFLMLFMMVPGFGAYKLVLKNGAVLELARKPDLSGKQVTAETAKGKRIIFPVRFVDAIATKAANEKKLAPKKPVIRVQKDVPDTPRKAVPITPVPATGVQKVPLVITNETVKKDVTNEVTNEVAAEETESSATEVMQQENSQTTNASSAVEGNDEPAGPTDDKGRTEEYWHEKFQANRELQAGVQKNLKKMQSKMNEMASQRLQTDDEMEKRRLAGKMQDLQKLIDKGKLQLQKLKENKKSLLEEARTSGALPGWYRDYED